MPYPRSKNKTHNLILETLELEEEAGRLLIRIDENKAKIMKYLEENGLKELVVPVTEAENNNVSVVCKKSERATVKYDVDKLKQKLDDEVFLEVTKRSYTIKDINAMVKLMKDAGVSAKEFKSLIDAKVTADGTAIKRLYDAGEITMKHLKGTYTATISKSIKLTERTGDKD